MVRSTRSRRLYERVFEESVSGTRADRPQLAAALSLFTNPLAESGRKSACHCHFLTLTGRDWNHLFSDTGRGWSAMVHLGGQIGWDRQTVAILGLPGCRGSRPVTARPSVPHCGNRSDSLPRDCQIVRRNLHHGGDLVGIIGTQEHLKPSVDFNVPPPPRYPT